MTDEGTIASERPRTRRRIRAIFVAPLLLVLALGAWVFASPAGASPDDDYHLISIWCAAGDRTSLCEETDSPGTRLVAEKLIGIACFARDSAETASCQRSVLESTELVESSRGNFSGEYPPVYYGVMSLFASDDVLTSVVIMRFVNVLLFTAIGSLLFALLPLNRRRTLVWGWLVSVVPLALFLIASNNPSSWAIIGVGSLPLALLGWFEGEGRRRRALGGLAVLSAVLAAGARADGALYTVLVTIAVVVLTARRTREYARALVVPGVVVVVAVVVLLTSTQILSGLIGFGGAAFARAPLGSAHGFAIGAETPPDLLGLLLSNILNTPSLWAGVFGSWSLGWFDTPLPYVVSLGGVAVFVATCFTGLRELDVRKLAVVVATGLGLWIIPVFTLTRGGDPVGVEVQPRYLLPLIVVLAMFALLTTRPTSAFTRPQTVLLAITLVGTFAVSIVFNIRRYASGLGDGANDLGGATWWGDGSLNPNVAAVIGCLAWAGLLVVVLRELARAQRVPGPTSIPSAS